MHDLNILTTIICYLFWHGVCLSRSKKKISRDMIVLILHLIPFKFLSFLFQFEQNVGANTLHVDGMN